MSNDLLPRFASIKLHDKGAKEDEFVIIIVRTSYLQYFQLGIPTKSPATKAPATKAPATKAPATKAPATKAPATKASATKTPATKAAATKVPTTKTQL